MRPLGWLMRHGRASPHHRPAAPLQDPAVPRPPRRYASRVDEPIFTERQVFYQNPVVRIVVPLVVVVGGGGVVVAINSGPPAMAPVMALAIALPALIAFMTLRTEVTPRELRFQMWPLLRRRLPIESIDEVEAVRYNPIVHGGGWGVRMSSRYGLVANVTGGRGVRVVAGTKRYLIGSLREEELAAAIAVAREAALETPPTPPASGEAPGETPGELQEA